MPPSHWQLLGWTFVWEVVPCVLLSLCLVLLLLVHPAAPPPGCRCRMGSPHGAGVNVDLPPKCPCAGMLGDKEQCAEGMSPFSAV